MGAGGGTANGAELSARRETPLIVILELAVVGRPAGMLLGSTTGNLAGPTCNLGGAAVTVLVALMVWRRESRLASAPAWQSREADICAARASK